ncbi:MAG: class I SAM-dependent methyltransferase [Pyrobaculum sp.]
MEFETFGARSAAFYNLLVSMGVFNWAYATAMALVRRLARPGSLVLEIGSGNGPLLQRLEKAGYVAVGIDASVHMLKYAQRRAPGISLAGVSFALPIRPESFHVAVALFTLHHWGPHEPSIDEIHKALKPGGHFIAVEVDQERMPLVGSHGCTKTCMERVLGLKFQVAVEKRFPLLVAVGRK